MGNKISLVPKYFRDFNIMNRASKEIELDKIKVSPRHPTTVEKLKNIEGFFYFITIIANLQTSSIYAIQGSYAILT